MVRACHHDGDPAELRDVGDVPALREHRLQLTTLQDPAGRQPRTHLIHLFGMTNTTTTPQHPNINKEHIMSQTTHTVH